MAAARRRCFELKTMKYKGYKEKKERLMFQTGATAQNWFTWVEIITDLNSADTGRASIAEGGGRGKSNYFVYILAQRHYNTQYA